jgi:drug/metabolite transporter (DMT)-like permease
MTAIVPLLTLFMAVPLKLERLTWRGVLGGTLVVIGVGAVFQEQLQAEVPPAALLVLVMAAVCAALSGIVIKLFPRSHPVSTNAVAMGIGAVLLVLISLVAGESWLLPSLVTTRIALFWLIASAIVAFILTIWLLSKWSASAVSYTGVLIPLVTVAVAALLAGERVTLTFVVGGAIALGGVYFGVLSGQSERQQRKPVTDKALSEASPG